MTVHEPTSRRPIADVFRKIAADRDKWVEITRKEYEKSHATNSVTPVSTPK